MKSEAKTIATRSNGQAIIGRDVPYFMSKQEFSQWFANIAREDFKAYGMKPDPTLTKMQFVSVLRNSKHPKSDFLRKSESREVGKNKYGQSIFGRDVPYFMTLEKFAEWQAIQARESLTSKGLKADEKLSKDEFIQMLRDSNSKDGENLVSSENKEIGKRPDGTIVYAKNIPYFMDHDTYTKWFHSQANEAKKKAIPTIENVNNFSGIHDVNAAIFLPPMAIISSLTSALTNGISLVLLIILHFLNKLPNTISFGKWIEKHNVLIMLIIFTLLLIAMPAHVFKEGTPIYDLETELHSQVGIAAKIWSRLSNLEKFIL